jgi:hypothetical protein
MPELAVVVREHRSRLTASSQMVAAKIKGEGSIPSPLQSGQADLSSPRDDLFTDVWRDNFFVFRQLTFRGSVLCPAEEPQHRQPGGFSFCGGDYF